LILGLALAVLSVAGCHPELVEPQFNTTRYRRLLVLDLEVSREGEAANRAANLGLGEALANALCDEIDQNADRYRYEAWKLRVDLDPTPAGVTVVRLQDEEAPVPPAGISDPLDLARLCGADAAVVGSVTQLEIQRLEPVSLDKVSQSGFALHLGQLRASMTANLSILSTERGQVIGHVQATVRVDLFDEFRPDQGQVPLLPSDDEVLRTLTLAMARKLGHAFYYSLDR
jgi:hypothetical protein